MKVALLFDGGYLRASARDVASEYNNELIEKFSSRCVAKDEYLLRIFYYDAPQYRGSAVGPVSGQPIAFKANDAWLDDLARRERFAVRRGTLGFRGWRPKAAPIAGQSLTDGDFSPIFEQKGVDMRIGLDIATFAYTRTVDRIVLVSGDQDMVPALKLARRCGLEVVVVQLPEPARTLHDSLLAHSDLVRKVSWV